jgi:hypothetical protein
MVKPYALPALAFAFLVLFSFFAPAFAWVGTYEIDNESVKIWINHDGTIDLFYNITVTLVSGENITFVNVGQPNNDFTIGNATDQFGNALSATDASEGTDYKVRVTLRTPLTAGHSIWFTLITNVGHMVYEDAQNPGNVGTQFIPTWWPVVVRDLRVAVVLPFNVNVSMVKTSVDWNNTFFEPDGRLAVYWERFNLAANQKYSFGVSFPQEYVQNYVKQPTGVEAFLQQYGPLLLLLVVFIVGLILLIIIVKKRAYFMPRIGMETLGLRRGLTAVEAAYLLGASPDRLVTMMLYSLLQKRAVWVEGVTPSIRLKVMLPDDDKPSSAEGSLRYYEIDFLRAIGKNGRLDEEKLAGTVMMLRDSTEEKMRGYRRQDTVDYYRSIVGKAWEQVERADTSELASKAYDEQLLWLMLDPNHKQLTEATFSTRPFEPNPLWLWYWYGYTYYQPHPTYKPSIEAPAQAAKPPAIPGADFANNIATSIEKTSNNFVVSIEKFANAILPMPDAGASHEPAQSDANCVCACATCACACACVSCACACAGGGVG